MADIISADIQCPSILFRLDGGLYCADSRHISSLIELPPHTTMPDAPPYITGIFPFRGGSVTMFDLRAALKLPTLADKFADFSQMLDARKADHANWIAALRHSVECGEPFTLATDPHQCALGQWYDSFSSDSPEVSAHLSKMEKPHALLHEAALRIRALEKRGDAEAKAEQQAILDEVSSSYGSQVFQALDAAKAAMRSREFHEMVLVLSGDTSLGLVVDEVVSVETVEDEVMGVQHQLVSYSPYIQRIVKTEKYPGELILEISIPAIIHTADRDQIQKLAASH